MLTALQQKDYDVAKKHANRGEDTCAFTVGMLIMLIDELQEKIDRQTSEPQSDALSAQSKKLEGVKHVLGCTCNDCDEMRMRKERE